MAGRYDTKGGVCNVVWSEVHENQLATASGDGSIKLWDVTLKVSARAPPIMFSAPNIQVSGGITGLSDLCPARTHVRGV